ncbi:ATP-binding protein [Clostridium butyricum]|uniref:ATP-binding protein n=3 Tax=Clostridium butyricum TaxID=1492 RepID=UPI0021C3D958|nr:ATP-binding protein [Clostridium butyricum]MCQ2011969.1 ATP-binding protein [Clostridium butyricum]
MALNYAHEGYEYQDLLTVYFIVKELICDRDSRFIIDKKDYVNDKFDDLKIISKGLIQQKQIKYSNEEVNHALVKEDLSSKGNHDIALDSLFLSWKECKNNNAEDLNIETRLCLAWDYPDKDDDINKVLQERLVDDSDKTFKRTKNYKVLIDSLWPEGSEPLNSWKRFKKASKGINRDEFKEFCNELIIELNYPKASLDIFKPGDLELEVIGLVNRLGVGKFPNEMIKIEDSILNLLHIVKKARSYGEELGISDILYRLGLNTNYGSIKQIIKINEDINIDLENRYKDFCSLIESENKIFLYGEPGSGKSWFVANLQEYMERMGINVIRHYCYTGLDDENDIKRIQTNVFYGNLIKDILMIYPDLKKSNKYAADKEELEGLLNQIDDELVIFVDGLDHIDRVYEMNKDKLRKDEINIIKTIEELNVKFNIKIILSSQPLSETTEIEESGFNLEKINSWQIDEVKLLMINFKIEDRLVEDEELSEILLKKSGGNPLYLNYLLSEIKNSNILVKSKLDEIPQYDCNLASYYNYVIEKLNGFGECVLKPLAGINFFVNKEELKEITGEGSYVDEAIEILKPILEENFCSKGIMIYHESFRRYILDRYSENGVDLKKKIYRDVIEWFEKSDFYSSPKAYRNYLNMLLDIQEYDKILTYLNKEFVVNSLVGGYSNELIMKNYRIFLKAATEVKSFSNISLILQLSNQIESTKEEFNEVKELYFKAVGYIYGFDRVNDLLSYEGECTLKQEEGLKVCYLCSINGVIPPWELYLTFDGEGININEFEYYVRYLFDSKAKEDIESLIRNIADEEFNNFKNSFLNEAKKYNSFNEVSECIKKLDINMWNTYLNNYDNNVINVGSGEVESLMSEILSITYLQEEDAEKVNRLLLILKSQVETDEECNFERIIDSFSMKNWFYNWLIFCIKIICFEKNINLKSDIEIDSELEKIYEYLVIDTDPGKGNVRACDLYNIEHLIRLKIFEPLKYVKSEDTWKVILNILTKVSNETTSSLQGTIMGPLQTDKYINLLEKIANNINVNIVCDIIEQICEKEADYRFYSYLGYYDLECAILNGKYNRIDKAKDKLKEGIKYITSYTFRKDITLTNLIESIDVIYKINNEVGKEKLLKLFDLADRAIYHTDGSETQYYPLECYKKLLKHNKSEALVFLRNKMLKSPNYWVNNDSVEEIINENDEDYPILKNYFYRMYVNRISEEYLEGFIKNIRYLYLNNKKENSYIGFVSLINKLDLIKKDLNISSEIYKDIISVSKLLCKDIHSLMPLYILNKSIVKENRKINSSINEFDLVKFSELSINEFINYFKKNVLRKEKINSFIYYFENVVDSAEDRKIIIDQLVSDTMMLKEEEHFSNLKLAFENMKIDSKMICYFYIRLYCYKKDGWYHRFIDKNALKKAFELDEDFTIKKMCEFIYEIFKKGMYDSKSFSNLLGGLLVIDYDKDEIIKSWTSMYNIVEYRLSGKEFDYSAGMLDDLNMDLEELMLCIILVQLNKEKVSSEKLVIDCIYYYIKHDCNKLYKPIKWLLINNEKFSEMNISIILQLIWENVDSFNYINELKEYLKRLYSYNNFMITFLVNKIFNEEEEAKEIILDNNNSAENDDKMDYCSGINKVMQYLEDNGVDVKPIYRSYLYELFNKEQGKKMCNIYFNRTYKFLIKNIYQENLFYKILNKNLLYSYYTNDKYDYNEIFNNELFDLNSIVAYENSKVIRPVKYMFPSEYKSNVDFISVDIDEDWIELAYNEREYVLDYNKGVECRKFIKTVIFDRYGHSSFNKLITKNIWDNNFDNDDIDYTKLVFKEEDRYNFEDNKILWINADLLKKLNLQLGECENGLFAINSVKEVVLKFENWETNYSGDDRYKNNDMPKIVGQRLIIKREYFIKICELMDMEPEYFVAYI